MHSSLSHPVRINSLVAGAVTLLFIFGCSAKEDFNQSAQEFADKYVTNCSTDSLDMEDRDSAKSQVADFYDDRGLEKQHSGDFKGAIEDYMKAIEACPERATSYYNIGTAKAASESYIEAIDSYGKAIELNPQYGVAYTNRGQAKSRLGKYKEAIEDYSKAIAIDGKDFYAHANRAHAKDKIGDQEGALVDYTKAIEILPRPGFYASRGAVSFSMGNAANACSDIRKAASLGDERSSEWLRQGGEGWCRRNE